MLYITEIKCF